MKIGIDANSLTRDFNNGTKRYAMELISSLAQIDKKNSYVLFASEKIKIPSQKNFKQVTLPRYPIFKRQIVLPLLIKNEKLDIFHNLDPFGPVLLRHNKMITTVHDLDLSVVYPTYLSIGYFFKRCYSEISKYFTLINSKVLVFDSKSIMIDFKHFYPRFFYKKTVRLVSLAQSSFFKLSKLNKNPKEYFLCMGDFSPRKNIETVFKSYLLLNSKYKNSYKLYLITSTSKEAKRFKEMAKKYLITSHLKIFIAPTDVEVRSLYQSAICFIYPSTYEGFGLPILEAMACGCPVITSNYGAMKEVSGGAGVLVDAKDPVNISNSMLGLIENSKLRKKLVMLGLNRAKKFSWNKTAKQTLYVYKSLHSLRS